MFFNSNLITSYDDSSKKIAEKGVDYKGELLDFNIKQKAGEKFRKPGLPSEIININDATAKQLESLPGIGRKTAEAIIEYRIRKVKFKKIDDLLKVKGIGKTKLEGIKNFIVVE